MSLRDPREQFFSTIDIDKCRIKHTSSPIVLLCGGKVKVKDNADDPPPSIRSFRHAIIDSHTPFEIFRPEEITTWQTDGLFKNLVDFEKELAAICSLVVIVLESPGSFAELGAFSQLQELNQKLVVINPSQFSDSGNEPNSFINLGILRHLKEFNTDSVKVFPWDISKPDEISSQVLNDSIESIKAVLDKIPKSTKLKITHDSHASTVVFELLNLFVALKEVEVVEYLNKLGFDLSKDQIKRKLFLLCRFQLIKNVEYDGAKFYCGISSEFNRLRLAAIEGNSLDSTQIPIDCKMFYKEIKDRHRLGAIKEFLDSRSIKL